MGKWLALAAAALVVVLLLLWRSIDDSAAKPVTSAQPAPTANAPVKGAEPTVVAAAKPALAPGAGEEPAAVEPAKPEKLDPMGDEFFNQFIELVPHKVSRDAAECYTTPGMLHRNQKLVLAYNVRVRDGVVTIHDVKIKPRDPDGEPTNTLNNPALESCFIQKVARVTWKNDALPDYDWPDELVIRPERGLKKHWKSNLEYVGEPAPVKDRSVHPGPK